MRPSPKAVSPLISYILIIAISIAAIAMVLIFGGPIINNALESATVNEAFNNINLLSGIIREVASEGAGSLRTIQLSVGGGSYRADSATSSLYFDYKMKSGIISPGTVTKQGDVQVIAGGAGASATDNSTNFILENEILKVVLNKGGNYSLASVVDGVNSGLVGWWKLDSVNSSNYTSDSSGYGNDGSLYNYPCSPATCNLTAGKFGSALAFDGSSSYVELPDLAETANGAVEGWFKPTNNIINSSGVVPLLGNNRGGGPTLLLGWNDAGGSGLVFGYNDGTWKLVQATGQSWTAGSWYHVVGIWGSGGLNLFVNGVSVVSDATKTGAPATQAATWGIGTYNSPLGKFFNGTIDEVRIYNRSLSADEIRALYQSYSTKYDIQSITNKLTGQAITPADSSIVLGGDPSSGYGQGYSRLVQSGTGLSQAQATYHLNSGSYNYNILYSLPSQADYLTVQLQNSTGNSTVSLRYNISANGLGDTFRFGNANESSLTGLFYNITTNTTQTGGGSATSYWKDNFTDQSGIGG